MDIAVCLRNKHDIMVALHGQVTRAHVRVQFKVPRIIRVGHEWRSHFILRVTDGVRLVHRQVIVVGRRQDVLAGLRRRG